MRLIRWIIGFTIAVLLAAFAVANRQIADITWSPVHEPLHWPLYLSVLSAMAFGFVLGGLIVWMSDFPLRRSARLRSPPASSCGAG